GRGAAHQAPAGANDTAPAASGSAADASGWTTGIADENLRRWAQAKGWKDPLAAVESNYNLERMIGLDRAGRTVVLPREDASPEEMRAYYQRIGVPENADGYSLPLPENAPPGFAREAAQWMHEAGVPAKSAALLAQRWNAHLAQSQEAAERSYKVESAAQLDALKGEWGSNFDANAEQARRAALHFLPGADVAARNQQMGKIERVLGSGLFMRFMANVGRGLSEHALVSNGDAGEIGAHSSSSARARIAQLRGDKAWSASYIAGDAAKAAEMARLHRVAFGREEE
ncbi:MAG: Uncharacterized protein JWN73_1, partial [Betaproteobacteria bacterium]|nr:Uncharacterized protein [Betaproteobacteria bacterium]